MPAADCHAHRTKWSPRPAGATHTAHPSEESGFGGSVGQNGQNGFISNDANTLRQYVEMLLNDESMCLEMGKNARETILTKFGMQNFINSWNEIFLSCVE